MWNGVDKYDTPRFDSGPSLLWQSHPPAGSGRPPKLYVCDQCGRGYRHAGSLQNHKNTHKTGSYFCTSCQKEYSNLMALKTHRRIHTEVKRHRCTDCGKAFRASSQLIVHRPKRHGCPECGKSFRVSTQLLVHQRVHTKDRPFPCHQCDRRFSSRSDLRHHVNLHWAGPGSPTRPAVSVPASGAAVLGVPQCHGGTKFGFGWGKGRPHV
uniref:C2H2-type domain-containing protein n=1 Tax=Esox lucius TaxID=8010 RepID=A0AAY5KCF8_ESOLU